MCSEPTREKRMKLEPGVTEHMIWNPKRILRMTDSSPGRKGVKLESEVIESMA